MDNTLVGRVSRKRGLRVQDDYDEADPGETPQRAVGARYIERPGPKKTNKISKVTEERHFRDGHVEWRQRGLQDGDDGEDDDDDEDDDYDAHEDDDYVAHEDDDYDAPSGTDDLPQYIEKKRAEERHFKEIFNYIIRKTGATAEEISCGVGAVIDSFRYDEGRQFSDVDLRRTDNMCGYLFRYAAHGAGLVRCRVLEAVRNCKSLRSRLERRRHLRAVSLGGGPGNDVLGFFSALNELELAGCVLKVTVVDAVREWGACVDLVKRLVRRGDFGGTSELHRRNQVSLSFCPTKLPGHPMEDDHCYLALENADVVLVSKFISVLEWKEKKELIQNLHEELREDALVVVIDAPFYDDLWTQFDVLYLSGENRKYRLSDPTYGFGHSDNFESKSRIAVLRKRATAGPA